MAEGARLESVFTRKGNVGSNPTLSAIPHSGWFAYVFLLTPSAHRFILFVDGRAVAAHIGGRNKLSQ